MGYVCRDLWFTWGDWSGLASWLAVFMPFLQIFGICQIFFVIYCQMFIVLIPSYGCSTEGIVKSCLFLFIAFSALATNLRCAFTNPGTVQDKVHIKKGSLDLCEKEGIHICKKCMIRKPTRAHHCSKCHTCIIKMDHHCPWVNNCVGVRNQKYFVQFIIYVFIGEFYAFLSGMSQLFSLYRFLKSEHLIYSKRIFLSIPYYSFQMKRFLHYNRYFFLYGTDYPLTSSFILLLESIFSLLFCIFVVMMFFDQLRNMQYDRTLIEQKKANEALTNPSSLYQCFTRTFGDPPCWRWLFPIEGRETQQYYMDLCHQFPTSLPITENTLLLGTTDGDIDVSGDDIDLGLCPKSKQKIE